MKSSSYSGFFKLSVDERLNEIAEFADLTEEEKAIIFSADSLDIEKADHMVENVIGREVVIPMVSEEPSVIAANSKILA